MENLSTTTWISVLALAISVISAAAAIGSVLIARKSLQHTKSTSSEERWVSFERERSALLDLITRNRSEFEKIRFRISSLKARYESSSEVVKKELREDAKLLDEHLYKTEGAIRQCWSLWDEVAKWDAATGIHALVHHQARYKTLVEDDRFDEAAWIIEINAFEENLIEARF